MTKEVWQCFSCGAECQLPHEGVDTHCPYGERNEDDKLMKTDWRQIE